MKISLGIATVALLGSWPAYAQRPDLILHNGKVFTANRDQLWAEAVAISGTRIVGVGTSQAILESAGPETRIIDVGRRVIVPGFNDAHYHPSSQIPSVRIRLADDPTLDDVLDSLRSAVGRTAPGTWFLGVIGGRVFDDPRTGRAALDEVTPDHPVLLSGWTGHGRVMNGAARRQLGPASEFGAGEWSDAGGEGSDNRILHGYAAFRTTARLERGIDSITIDRLARLESTALAFGITSLQAMSFPLPEQTAAAALAATGPRLRWSFIRFPINNAGLAPSDERLRERSPLFSVGGVKFVLDGTPEERRMLLRSPYADMPDWRGQAYLTQARLRAAVDRAVRTGQQLAVHAVGDSAISLLFRSMRAYDQDGWPARRVRVEHGDGMTPDLVREARGLGVVVVQNPAHLTLTALLPRRLGAARMADFQPMRALVEAGVPLALGSDGPLSPFLNIMFAVLHPANPSQALSVEEAVIAYTWGSAYAQFAEGDKGTITPGKLADLAVLSQDIFTIATDELPATTSLLTLVGGRIAHATGPFGPN